MNKARAAQIWDQLERQLIEHCGLPNGRMLELARPGLIRRIGEALGVTKSSNALPHYSRRAAAAKSVRPPLPPRVRPDFGDTTKPLPTQDEVDQIAERASRRVRENRTDTVHDPHLAELLERACSRRMGYDGDDEVTYAGSR